MNIAVYTKQELNKEEVISCLKKKFDFNICEDNPKYVFTFGGDGTFLDAVNVYGTTPIYVPINFGNLGFYTSWNNKTMSDIDLDGEVMHLPLVDIEVINKHNQVKKYSCVNDATILNPIHTLIIDVYVNDFHLEHFRGTGVCLSTPSGSTAYNKSLGGSVISPSKELFQLTHIAPINNIKYRNIGNSIIFDKTEVISLYPTCNEFEQSLLTIDRKTIDLKGVTKINVSISSEKVAVLISENYNFYQRVYAAFISE